MKLTDEVKQKIDEFFDNINANELFELAVNKYGFQEQIGLEITCQAFSTIHENQYHSKEQEVFEERDKNSYALAA